MAFSGFLSALPAIAVLAVLITVHELGHFLAARLQGIYANKFSIGFGPVLWKYQGPETEYALRAFPLGGFVGFPDDDPEANEIDPNDPNLLRNRPILDRAIVISAGVIANLVFAYLVLLLMVGTVGVQQASQPGILINGFFKVNEVSGQAAQLGIKPGEVLFIDERQNLQKFDVAYDPKTNSAELLVNTSPAHLKVRREDANGKPKLEDITFTPALNATGQGQTGITLNPTPAIKAGLEPGDVVLGMNGYAFTQSIRELQRFQSTIRDSAEQPVEMQVQRGDRILNLTVVPTANGENEGTIGVGLSFNGDRERQPIRGFAALSAAAEEFQNIVVDTVDGFGKLISRFSQVADQVAGPVAIVAVGAKIAQSDAASLFQFAALISINLAIINILPLPALDGGHLAFLLIEGLRGKPLPSKIQDGVMQTGLVLLLGLGIFLIIRDTANLIPQ
ncbi:MAG: RIP metalloprotease RseP [Leptolyngbyaceae cyanobacterium bins.349]|nr:RIP metalloprotease RseP [Leptolyngbyaceae cyanobacterium bins.349]